MKSVDHLDASDTLIVLNFLPIGLIKYSPFITGKLLGVCLFPIITSLNLILSPYHLYSFISKNYF